MNEIFSVGPFLIKYQLLITIIGSIIGYFFLVLRINKMQMDKQLITDMVLGTVIIYVIFWRFGGLLFDPRMLLDNPISILYQSSSGMSTVIALVISAFYIIYRIKKNKISVYQFLDLLPFGILPFFLIYNLAIPLYGNKTSVPWGIAISNPEIKYHPINYYYAIIITCLMIYFMLKKDNVKNNMYFTITVNTVGVSVLLLSFLAPIDLQIIGISYAQLLSMILILIGIGINMKEYTSRGE